MKRHGRSIAVMIGLGLGLGLGLASADPLNPATSSSTAGTPVWAQQADVTEHLGASLPEGLIFTDTTGKRVPLASLFDGTHPVLLVLAYYECPQLCSLVLDAAVRAMRALDDRNGFSLGTQYRAATISFDDTEHPDQAARKQAAVLGSLGRPDAPWPFLVGYEREIKQLTDALGFSFARDPRTKQLAHPAVAFVLTPDGKVSRYLYGIDYPPRDLKLALLEASDGKTGSFADKVLLRCFHYDPTTRRYGLFVTRFMQLGGALIFVIAIVTITGFARAGKRRRQRDAVQP